MSNSQFRVVSYTNEDFSGHQLLQRRRFWGWQTVDREDVPAHARISAGAFGDTGGWVSKFSEFGVFKRDGALIPHAEKNNQDVFEHTPRLLQMFGKPPFRKYVNVLSFFGDFSYWAYSDGPNVIKE